MAILIADTETREILRRIKELSFAFGDTAPYTLCEQIESFMQSLLDAEKTRKLYKWRSPQHQRSLRLSLVLFMMKIAEGERLTSATLFSAVYLFDRFFDVHSIADKQLHLVAVSCLIIAGKMEEKDSRTPKIKRLQGYIPGSSDYSNKLFVMIERFILGFYDFRVIVPTEVNFLELYMLFAMDGSDIVMNNNSECTLLQGRPTTLSSTSVHILKSMQTQANLSILDKTTLDKIHNCAMKVLQTLLKYEPTMDYSISLITAAVLLYARREVGLNFWTQRLAAVTTYNHRQVVICLRYYVEPKMMPNNNSIPPNYPDSSYICSDHSFSFQ